MTTQHTPGIWRAVGIGRYPYATVMAGDVVVAGLPSDGTKASDTTMHANAQLIAAAPELLGLLQRYVEFDVNTDRSKDERLLQTSNLYRSAVAAIAKATGAAQ